MWVRVMIIGLSHFEQRAGFAMVCAARRRVERRLAGRLERERRCGLAGLSDIQA